MPDHLLAIVVNTDDPASELATLAAAATLPVARAWSEPFNGTVLDRRDELEQRFDKATVAADVVPKSYIEYRGGLTYEECLTVLGWYAQHHSAETVTPEDEAVATIIAPPGVDPLDPPAELPEA